eukprot:3891212-Amphidinium_carterae.1
MMYSSCGHSAKHSEQLRTSQQFSAAQRNLAVKDCEATCLTCQKGKTSDGMAAQPLKRTRTA